MPADLAEWQAGAIRTRPSPAESSLVAHAASPAVAVAALTIAGVVLRVIVAGQSVFADELSTYWISATHSLRGVISLMYGTHAIPHPEITPPLSFIASWVTTRLGRSPELLRLPSLIAGAITIPAVYVLGLRTVGRRAALVAAALTTFSPFMIYYSAEARAYGLMMMMVVISTLAVLLALDTGRKRWWVLYGVSSSAAVYTHYTSVFVLGAQFVWIMWAHPAARRATLITNLAAAASLLPWLPGLINDFDSPTLKILSALSPFTSYDVRLDLEHWLVGYPYTLAGGLTELPGVIAVVLLACAAILAGVGLARRARGGKLRTDRCARVWLVVVLACATPIGEAVISALGNHIFGVRNLAASWPYLALACSAALVASGPRVRLLAAGMAIVALGLGAVKMLSPRFQRPDYQTAASFVAGHALPGDVVVDETGALSPGPLTGLDVSLHRPLPVFRGQAPAERGHPFGFSDRIVPLEAAIRSAVRNANGHRVFLVTNLFTTDIEGLRARVSAVPGRFPEGYRLVASRTYPGIGGTVVALYAPAT
jgi:hypothetical protein